MRATAATLLLAVAAAGPATATSPFVLLEAARDRLTAAPDAAAAETGLAGMREGLRRMATREAALEARRATEAEAAARRLAMLAGAAVAPRSAWALRAEDPAALQASARALGAAVVAAPSADAALASRIADVRAARAAAEAARRALATARDRLAEGEPAADAALEAVAAFEAARGGRPPARPPEPRPARGPGRLPAPVDDAEIRLPRGAADETGAPSPGVTLAAAPDAPVRAPAAAFVLWSGRTPAQGAALVVELAPGRLLLLAGLGQVHVAAGDAVPAGAVLGRPAPPAAGAAEFLLEAPFPKGALSAATLYIEARDAGRSVDPGAWFDLDGKADLE